MTELIDTTEMYLRTIFELQEEGVVPLRARIAERLGHSGPTVSQTIARMERDGLVVLADGRRLELTGAGQEQATRVMRKHRLAERLLVDVIGLPWHEAHEEACRWEHVMSVAVEERVLALVGGASDSPYGTPIPGLPELGAGAAAPFLDGVEPLTAVLEEVQGDGAAVVVMRLGEFVQVDAAQLLALREAGVAPGARVRAALTGGSVTVEGERGRVVLSAENASHLFVRRDQAS